MKVMIIDIDSTIPNFALKKIEKHHIDKGDSVVWNLPIIRESMDKIYVSCIFDWNKYQLDDWINDDKVVIGGSGYDYAVNYQMKLKA